MRPGIIVGPESVRPGREDSCESASRRIDLTGSAHLVSEFISKGPGVSGEWCSPSGMLPQDGVVAHSRGCELLGYGVNVLRGEKIPQHANIPEDQGKPVSLAGVVGPGCITDEHNAWCGDPVAHDIGVWEEANRANNLCSGECAFRIQGSNATQERVLSRRTLHRGGFVRGADEVDPREILLLQIGHAEAGIVERLMSTIARKIHAANKRPTHVMMDRVSPGGRTKECARGGTLSISPDEEVSKQVFFANIRGDGEIPAIPDSLKRDRRWLKNMNTFIPGALKQYGLKANMIDADCARAIRGILLPRIGCCREGIPVFCPERKLDRSGSVQ